MLFFLSLNVTDYKGWARGLKKAGYATSPTYADRLIKIIEEFDLHRYDRMVLPEKTEHRKSGKPNAQVAMRDDDGKKPC